jgi:hypothetical protein
VALASLPVEIDRAGFLFPHVRKVCATPPIPDNLFLGRMTLRAARTGVSWSELKAELRSISRGRPPGSVRASVPSQRRRWRGRKRWRKYQASRRSEVSGSSPDPRNLPLTWRAHGVSDNPSRAYSARD